MSKIPEGYKEVTEGVWQLGDLIWRESAKKWIYADHLAGFAISDIPGSGICIRKSDGLDDLFKASEVHALSKLPPDREIVKFGAFESDDLIWSTSQKDWVKHRTLTGAPIGYNIARSGYGAARKKEPSYKPVTANAGDWS